LKEKREEEEFEWGEEVWHEKQIITGEYKKMKSRL